MSEPKIVIGAGAAGLTAAAVCAERGGRVLLIEKMERPGRKLRITGKGRCNVTNATFDLQGLLEHIPTNPRFLYSAFSNFMPYNISPICYYYEVVVFRWQCRNKRAGVAELADAPGLGSGG